MQSRRKPEVMSPAGHWPQLHAAIDAGADSVYFGLHHFSARAKVGFTLEELPEAMRTLHRRGVRGFVTFNTLVFEHEIQQAAKTIASIAESGADAIIVQDVGILKLARQIVPELEIHASTQMSITDSAGVRLAQSLGAKRVTLARELSLQEVRRIVDETDCEIEIFVHGALCVAYSGQCFSSEAWGGRSANRGQCAQACRLPYEMLVDGKLEPLADARYLLSPGDLYALHQIPEIIASGVAAVKIEGRYKDADYVALATRAYRKAVDEAPITPEEELQLEQVYSRGMGPHFLTGTNHQEVVRGRAPRHRGVLMGKVASVELNGVVVETAEAQNIAPLKAGDGLVFDAADWRSPQEDEEGGRVYQALPRLDGRIELRFANNAVRFDRIRSGDLVWRTDDPALDRVIRALQPSRQRVHIRVEAAEGLPLRATWTVANTSVTVQSSSPLEAATARGLSTDLLRDQFGRLGSTPYELSSLTAEINGAPFVQASLLNQLRREAVELLQQRQAEVPSPQLFPVSIPASKPEPRHTASGQIHLLVRTPEQLEAALTLAPASITLDYLDLYGLRPSVERVKESGITVRVASPRVLKPGEARIVDFLRSLECAILVRAAGMLERLGGVALIGDFSLNVANALTAGAMLELGLERTTPTHDLNAAQIATLAAQVGPDRVEVVAYHHLPVFHTEHCVFCRFLSKGTTYRDCGRPCEQHRVALKDALGRAHPVMADVGCRNTVFGAEAQEASAHFDAWREAGLVHFRLEFVHESAGQVEAITRAFNATLQGSITAQQLARELKRIAPEGTTQGSLFVAKDYLSLPVLQ